MLKSGVGSATARAVGYAIATGCVAMFAYALTIVVRAVASGSDRGVWLWAGVWAGIPLVATVALTVYVWRSPHPGGYALVGVACVIGTFSCMMAIFPLAVI